MENIRSFFPGGNTPEGFYSYYDYILGQNEAEHIICIKGGPGTGKSSLMKGIGEYFHRKNEKVEYYWCSSDPDSLDGIVLCDRKIAFIDGTSPHVTDPVNPGAVDSILNLGGYWDSAAIKKEKCSIIHSHSIIKNWFDYAYFNLKAASVVGNLLENIYSDALLPGEVYKVASDIVDDVFENKEITLSMGKCKKFFATAITPKGNISKMPSIIKDYRKLFCVISPVGFNTTEIVQIISDNAIHRGYSIEQFYCPMNPEQGIEHVLIPELNTGVITLNNYHDLEEWQLGADVITVDMHDCIDWNSIEKFKNVITESEKQYSELINMAIGCLKNAKQEHDILEGYYIPNMDFEKIDKLKDEWIAKIEQNKV